VSSGDGASGEAISGNSTETFICTSASSSSCFAGSETAELESGETVLLSEVKVGDRVMASDMDGKIVFSEVVAVPHAPNTVTTQFVHLHTEARDVKLTADHLIMSGSCAAGAPMGLVTASEVEVGACVKTVQGLERVVAVDAAVSKGVYTFVTKESLIVVNGFVASPFATNHAVADAYYNIHRALYAWMPSLLTHRWMKQANLIFGTVVDALTA